MGKYVTMPELANSKNSDDKSNVKTLDINIPELTDAKNLARIFGITERTIQALTKSGVLSSINQPSGRGKKIYDTAETVQKYVDYKMNGDLVKQKREATDMMEEKIEADIRLKNIRADKLQIEVNELKGKMHRSEDVEALVGLLIDEFKSRLLSLPSLLSVQVAPITNPSEISFMIKKECAVILKDLMRFQYSNEEYHKRALARQKLELENMDDDESE